MRRKNYVYVIVTLWIIFFMLFVSLYKAVSVPAKPSATCKLVGKILDIQEISQPYPSLLLKLKVLNLSCPQNQTNKFIPSKEGIESSFTIYRGEQKLKIGEIIEGIIYFGGDERFHGYFLTDVTFLKTVSEGERDNNLKFILIAVLCLFLIVLVTLFIKTKAT